VINKNKTKFFLLAALFLPLFAYSASNYNWTDLNGRKTKNGLASIEKANETNIAVSDSGKVYLAFQNKRDRVFVREFDGLGWTDLPGDSRTSYLARNGLNPVLETKDSDVYATYMDLDAGGKARVRKWNGASWSNVEDSGHAQGYISARQGFEPELCFDNSKENLYAAFRDEASGERIRIMKWNESSGWSNVSDGSNPDGLISSSTASEVALAASQIDDQTYAAFEDINSGGRIRVKKWTGASWENLSDGNHPEGLVSEEQGFSPALATDASGNLFLVYAGKGYKNIYVLKWSGSFWEDVGGGIAETGGTVEPAIIADRTGKVFIAYSKKIKRGKWKVKAKVWDSGSWEATRSGGSIYLSRGKGKGDPFFATSGNRLHISFSDSRQGGRARIKFLNLGD
jgi:hypothetical protein